MDLLKTVVELTEEKYSLPFQLEDLLVRVPEVESTLTPAVPVVTVPKGINALFAKDMDERLSGPHLGVCPFCANRLSRHLCVTRHGTR